MFIVILEKNVEIFFKEKLEAAAWSVAISESASIAFTSLECCVSYLSKNGIFNLKTSHAILSTLANG